MDTEHVSPPGDFLEAQAAAVRLDTQSLYHIRGCPRCRVAWYRVGAWRAGCAEPRLGARVLGALGAKSMDTAVRAHLERCLTCRVLALEAKRAGFMPLRATGA